MIRRAIVLPVAIAAIGAATTSVVQASGFALREFSGTGQGNAYAGATASAEDVSFMAFNPAGITRHRGENMAFNLSTLVVRSEYTDEGSTTVLGAALTGDDGGDDLTPDHLVPAFYYSREFSPRWFGGVSFTVPFGLATEYDSGWVGRYHALKSDIRSYNFNPIVAYKATDVLSVAGGIQIAYTRGILTNAVDFGTLDALPVASGGFGGAFGGTPQQDDGVAEVEGDDLALGFNLGLLYQLSPETRVGLAYRSKLHNQLDGAANFNNSAVGDAIAASQGLFTRTGARAEINLPETISAGIHHDIDGRLAVMGELAWTRWERLKELRVEFDNASQPDEVSSANWKNTWFVAVGATYRAGGNWTLRAGLAYDQSPVPDNTRTPRIPDEDRTWLSFGANYRFSPSASLDIGYTHLFVDGALVNLSTSASENALRGNLKGSYDSSVDILAVQMRLRF